MHNDAEQAIVSIGNLDLYKNISLKPFTGFNTGGNAAYLAAPHSARSFIEVITTLRRQGQRFYILGNGSNVIAPDTQYDGWVVKTDKAFTDIIFDDDAVYCGAGVTLARMCRNCAEHGLSGLEFAYGIPGSVGGAVFMNAGAYGGEMKDVVVAVKVIDKDGSVLEIARADMEFGYRTSAIEKHGYIVIGALFKLMRADKAEILARMRGFMNSRAEKQPLDYPSCGSTFKRPAEGFASKLIDECGLRGVSVGGAAVSEKHCGFVINKGGATSADVFALIKLVMDTVKEKTDIILEKEIRILE